MAKNASTRANIGQLGWLGAFACPLVSWARAPPGWAGPRGHSLARTWLWAPHWQKTQCISQKPQRPGQCWLAQAVGGFELPVGEIHLQPTGRGWATKTCPGLNLILKAARG